MIDTISTVVELQIKHCTVLSERKVNYSKMPSTEGTFELSFERSVAFWRQDTLHRELQRYRDSWHRTI